MVLSLYLILLLIPCLAILSPSINSRSLYAINEAYCLDIGVSRGTQSVPSRSLRSFAKLIISLRTAYANEYSLDKEVRPRDHLILLLFTIENKLVRKSRELVKRSL